MHILICGLGSIGRRHLRHFRSLGVERISAYRSGKATLPDNGQTQPDETFNDLNAALAQKPDAVVVANPTRMHLDTATRAVRAGCHVLVEKPISHSPEGLDQLVAAAEANNVIVSVAQNMRYHPQLIKLKKWIESTKPFGDVLMFRSHFGAYLPDWHPWEDFRDSYAARSELGGGCRRTHIHELDFTVWMLGEVDACRSIESTRHPLDTDVDEGVGYLMRFKSGALATITLSLFEKPPVRNVEVIFSRGRVTLDLITGEMVAVERNGRKIRAELPEGFDIDQTYRDQNAEFLSVIKEKLPAPVPTEEAAQILRLALS